MGGYIPGEKGVWEERDRAIGQNASFNHKFFAVLHSKSWISSWTSY